MLLLDVTRCRRLETMGGVVEDHPAQFQFRDRSECSRPRWTTDRRDATSAGERELLPAMLAHRFSSAGFRPCGRHAARAGAVQIHANGILSVTSRELRTESVIPRGQAVYGLTAPNLTDAARIVRHAEADFAARLLTNARNGRKTVILRREVAAIAIVRELAPTSWLRRTRTICRLAGSSGVNGPIANGSSETHALNEATPTWPR